MNSIKDYVLVVNKSYELNEDNIKSFDFFKNNGIKIIYISKKKNTVEFRKKLNEKIEKYRIIFILELFHITIDLEYLSSIKNKLILSLSKRYKIYFPKEITLDIFREGRIDDLFDSFFNEVPLPPNTKNEDIEKLDKEYIDKDNPNYINNSLDFFNFIYKYQNKFSKDYSSDDMNKLDFEQFYIYDISILSKNEIKIINNLLKAAIQKIGRDKKRKKDKTWQFGRPTGARGKSIFDKDKESIRYKLKQDKTQKEIHDMLGYGSFTGLKYFIKTRFRNKYI